MSNPSLASSNIPLPPDGSTARPGDELERCVREQQECLAIMPMAERDRWYPVLGWLDWGIEQDFIRHAAAAAVEKSKSERAGIESEAKPS
jgi:hypothetical protein